MYVKHLSNFPDFPREKSRAFLSPPPRGPILGLDGRFGCLKRVCLPCFDKRLSPSSILTHTHTSPPRERQKRGRPLPKPITFLRAGLRKKCRCGKRYSSKLTEGESTSEKRESYLREAERPDFWRRIDPHSLRHSLLMIGEKSLFRS